MSPRALKSPPPPSSLVASWEIAVWGLGTIAERVVSVFSENQCWTLDKPVVRQKEDGWGGLIEEIGMKKTSEDDGREGHTAIGRTRKDN